MLNWLLGRVEIEIPDGKGGFSKKYVPKKMLDEAIKNGHAEIVNACKVVHDDIDRGVIEEVWKIGEDIPQEVYDQAKDRSGKIYALTYKEKGERTTIVMTKSKFDEHQSNLRRMGLR